MNLPTPTGWRMDRTVNLQSLVQTILALGLVFSYLTARDQRLAVLEQRVDQQAHEAREIKDDLTKRLDRLETKLDRVLEGK